MSGSSGTATSAKARWRPCTTTGPMDLSLSDLMRRSPSSPQFEQPSSSPTTLPPGWIGQGGKGDGPAGGLCHMWPARNVLGAARTSRPHHLRGPWNGPLSRWICMPIDSPCRALDVAVSRAAARARRALGGFRHSRRGVVRPVVWALHLMCGLLAAGLSTTPAMATTFGLSDQNEVNLADSRFAALPMDHVRLVVPWDAALTEPGRAGSWLLAASQRGLTPLVAFARARGDRCPDNPCVLPSIGEYLDAVAAFRARWPQVREFTPWNEPNHPNEPTASSPVQTAGFHDGMRRDCSSCVVVAGDTVDSASMRPWVREYRAALKTTPQAWSLHNYGDVTYERPSYTQWLLDLVSEPVWITETGGIVRLSSGGVDVLPYDESRAEASMRKALALIDAHPTRIARAYVYHWRADPLSQFDSGLVREDGSLRPSFETLRVRLGERPPVTLPPAGSTSPAGSALPAGSGGRAPTGDASALGSDGVSLAGAAVPGGSLAAPRVGSRRPQRTESGWRVFVRCPVGRRSCRGRVTLTASRGTMARRIRLGSAPFRLGNGKPRWVRVRVARAPLRQARALRRWHLTASIVTRDPPTIDERSWPIVTSGKVR